MTPEEKQALDELRQYMLCDEGSWVVGDGFLNFIGKVVMKLVMKLQSEVFLLIIFLTLRYYISS